MLAILWYHRSLLLHCPECHAHASHTSVCCRSSERPDSQSPAPDEVPDSSCHSKRPVQHGSASTHKCCSGHPLKGIFVILPVPYYQQVLITIKKQRRGVALTFVHLPSMRSPGKSSTWTRRMISTIDRTRPSTKPPRQHYYRSLL